MRDKWVTALRYCCRNAKELGTVTRPQRDLARGNILAAMLTDELHEVKEKNKKLKVKLLNYKSKGKAGTALSSEQAENYKSQIETLKKQNAKLAQIARAEKAKRKGSGADGGSTVEDSRKKILQLNDKIRQLEDKQQVMGEENKKLKDQISVMKEELETQKVIYADDMSASKMREQSLQANLSRKIAEAQEQVEKAESEVMAAEELVRRRQEIIRNSMRILADRKTALANTEQTMEVLGITGKQASELTDDTAIRLAELYSAQKKEQQEAEAVLLKEYGLMVSEAEALNEKNERLARQNYVKEKHEQLHKQVADLSRTKRPGSRGPLAGGIPRRSPGQGGDKDDGCVIA